MKVALSVEHLDPARGGAETYMHWLAGRLARDGHTVHVVARSLPAVLPPGVTGTAVRPRGLTQTGRAVDFLRRTGEVLATGRYDVVHATSRTLAMTVYQPHGGTTRGSMEANLAILGPVRRRLRRLRWALSPRRRTFLAIERRQFRGIGGQHAGCAVKGRRQTSYAVPRFPELIAISEMVRAQMERYYGVPRERITVVYNGVNVERFSPAVCAARRGAARAAHGFADGDVVAALVAHNPRLKGLPELLTALARARGACPRLRLLVAGRFAAAPFARRARRLGVPGAVTFVGPADDVLSVYAAADCYVQPTYYDPCSLTVLEALACGLPVVTTRMNGVSELMIDGREGVVLDRPGDVERLAGALVDLCDDERRRTMGAAARELAQDHSTEHNYRDILAVYDRATRSEPA